MLFWVRLDENLCWMYFPRQQNTGKTFYILFLIRKKAAFIFYVTLKRCHHILDDKKLSLLIITALYEILSKSDLYSSWLPLILKWYWDFGFGHLKHLYREQKAVVRGLVRAGIGQAINYSSKRLYLGGVNLDPNAFALLSYLKVNCISLLHSGFEYGGWAVRVST